MTYGLIQLIITYLRPETVRWKGCEWLQGTITYGNQIKPNSQRSKHIASEFVSQNGRKVNKMQMKNIWFCDYLSSLITRSTFYSEIQLKHSNLLRCLPIIVWKKNMPAILEFQYRVVTLWTEKYYILDQLYKLLHSEQNVVTFWTKFILFWSVVTKRIVSIRISIYYKEYWVSYVSYIFKYPFCNKIRFQGYKNAYKVG